MEPKNTFINVEPEEYKIILKLLDFLQSKEYGEFSVVINYNYRTKEREVLTNITDKYKTSLIAIRKRL